MQRMEPQLDSLSSGTTRVRSSGAVFKSTTTRA